MSAQALLKVGLSAVLSSTVDIGTVEHAIEYGPNWPFSDGTGANQIQQVFSDTRTLSASATENIDLAGGLTNAFGVAITFTKIKAIVIRAAAGNTNNVQVGGAASNGFTAPFVDATDKLSIKPGGVVVLAAPDANGFAVTAGTGNILLVANSAGSTGVTYDILILGV